MHYDETNQNRIISILHDNLGTAQNPLPFPPQGDWLNLSLQSMAFQILFPCGIGNMTDYDCISKVSLTNSSKHLLKNILIN